MSETVYKAPERIDAANYLAVEKELGEVVKNGAESIFFDMSELKYISSAGLRILLTAQKELQSSGGIILTNVPDAVREILDMTGFSGVLAIR